MLTPDNANGVTGLIPDVGKLGARICSGGAVQVFTIELRGRPLGTGVIEREAGGRSQRSHVLRI